MTGIFSLKNLFVFYFPTHDWFNNHLKHLRSTRLGVLIRPMWAWHQFRLVYRPWDLNSQPFDLELSRTTAFVFDFFGKRKFAKNVFVQCWSNWHQKRACSLPITAIFNTATSYNYITYNAFGIAYNYGNVFACELANVLLPEMISVRDTLMAAPGTAWAMLKV